MVNCRILRAGALAVVFLVALNAEPVKVRHIQGYLRGFVVLKVVGKQPLDTHIWTAAGNASVFLKSEGPLFEDGPIWRIELTSPVWPKAK